MVVSVFFLVDKVISYLTDEGRATDIGPNRAVVKL